MSQNSNAQSLPFGDHRALLLCVAQYSLQLYAVGAEIFGLFSHVLNWPEFTAGRICPSPLFGPVAFHEGCSQILKMGEYVMNRLANEHVIGKY